MSAGKPTTIVAIDVSRFSALAQADEAAAIASVARLIERCAKSADEHGGRIFHTAGDAVMMEFSSVSGALYAAAELAADPDPPIRVGVHLGEASQMPSGDLLGHGISVASQLQAHARPGGVMVSEDARRALHGTFANRLLSKGSIKIEKTGETVSVYELTSDTPDVVKQRAARTRLVIAGAAALLALMVLAVLAWPLLNADPPTRVAVLSLVAPDDDALQGLAAGVAEDITLAVNARGLETLARESAPDGTREDRLERARQARAPLALDGAVERDGQTVRVTMALTRTDDRAALWSEAFEGPADAAPALRLRAAASSADVMACGLAAIRERRQTLDGGTLALLLGACSHARDPERLFDNREALAQVVAREPDSALAQAMLAWATAKASEAASESMREQLRTEARTHAERALQRDRHAGDAYLALQLLERRRAWDAREGILLRGLELDERNSGLNAQYSTMLLEVGRSADALAFARNSSTLDPLSLSKRYGVGAVLLQNGDIEAARDIAEEQARAWPDDPALWMLRFRVAFWSGNSVDALALLDAPASQVRSTRARQCWRNAIDAVPSSSGSPARASALQHLLECNRGGDLPAVHTLMQLSTLGELDEAFALARLHFVDDQRGGEDVLFSAATRAMRTDPRFMPLMKDLGLLGYWRLSARWPDFCRELSLPYRCQAEAQRLL